VQQLASATCPDPTAHLQITGIASTPDYHEYMPTAKEYRRFAPGYGCSHSDQCTQSVHKLRRHAPGAGHHQSRPSSRMTYPSRCTTSSTMVRMCCCLRTESSCGDPPLVRCAVRDYRRHSKYTARTVTASEPLDLTKVGMTSLLVVSSDVAHAPEFAAQLFKNAPVKPEEVKYTTREAIINNRGY
jgi:hypothetical protein